jgi:hypothetical protein
MMIQINTQKLDSSTMSRQVKYSFIMYNIHGQRSHKYSEIKTFIDNNPIISETYLALYKLFVLFCLQTILDVYKQYDYWQCAFKAIK